MALFKNEMRYLNMYEIVNSMWLNHIHIMVWRLSLCLTWNIIYDIKSVHNHNSVLQFFLLEYFFRWCQLRLVWKSAKKRNTVLIMNGTLAALDKNYPWGRYLHNRGGPSKIILTKGPSIKDVSPKGEGGGYKKCPKRRCLRRQGEGG